ncbi:MAG: hypothetical protein E6K69_00255 [Nitrospirae bacterium]|nr:MAG: hypothetical protein E6K69_00255 [Nitrospirota bacterium]
MKRVIGLVTALGLSACTLVTTPPQEFVAKHDQAALAIWYEKEAANLRQKARDMEIMIEEYRKDRERGRTLMLHPPKADFVQECRNLASMYTDAARQAENLAKSHREMIQ